MTLDAFIARWSASGQGERANKDSFLNELAEALGVERPHPKTGDPARDLFVFEKDVPWARAERSSTRFIDLYKHGCFVLEAKQGAASGPKRRDTPAWNLMMSEAHGQAVGYASQLPEPPPFLLVCDIGHCFDVYASFDGTGLYRAFPDGQRKRIFFRDLALHADLLRAIWTDPASLDPAKRTAAVTREIAARIADLARALEAAGHDPETVATFLMRCLFTMFAEDVGLLQERPFSHALENFWLPNPSSFPGGVGLLWRAMDQGGDFVTGKLLRFNGGLFAEYAALPLTKDQLGLLLTAARSDWSQVDPSIFGTLLERALNPKERHRLGAHYTPRAYVERLVKPTIEEPLRGDWDLVRAEVRQLVEQGKVEMAQARVKDFHHVLCRTRVLDPACGTGNFLYVTLDLFKRLESEVLALLAELGYKQISFEMENYRVTPEQFLGLEVKRWAKEIAELVLWIGYLQWQVRQPGGALTVPQPVLRDYGNIQWRDAVLAYDREQLLLDDSGKPVTRWDGETMKVSPVTGEEIPDDVARVPVFRYVNPRRAEWPKADFIVGNPPYIGGWKARQALGDGYLEALWSVYPEVPEKADFVMYWWLRSSEELIADRLRRAGLITTNSLRQVFQRRVVGHALQQGVRIRWAIPDHPWVDNESGAAVRVAMTVIGMRDAELPAGSDLGTLESVIDEIALPDGASDLVTKRTSGQIQADLRVGASVSEAQSLRANDRVSSPGVQLYGAGFVLTSDDLERLGFSDPATRPLLIRPYRNGKDLTDRARGVWAIDCFGIEEADLRRDFPQVYQHLLARVKPERDQNRRAVIRDRWWRFGWERPGLRLALAGLVRYVATPETAKHRFFVFLESSVLPDNMLTVIAVEDAQVLGVLSSKVHVTWSLAAGGRLGVGNDPRYTKGVCFDPFPFPTCSPTQQQRIRDLGEALDAHRKARQALHPKLTLTGMYNVLEKLRSGEALTVKEREIHEQGLVSVLKQIHDDLDAAVFDAYGWQSTLTDEEILERLVALNHERAEEEKQGLIRWLRPEFQNPQGVKAATQATLVEAGLEAPAPATPAKGKRATKPTWPKALPARVVAARDLLAEAGEATAADFARRFKGVKAEEAATVLESLAAVGVAIETTTDTGVERSWRLVR